MGSEHPYISVCARISEYLREYDSPSNNADADLLDDVADLLRRNGTLLPPVVEAALEDEWEETQPVEGVVTAVILAPGQAPRYSSHDLDLPRIQHLVGGHYEQVTLDAETVMLIGEDAKAQHYAPNPVATRLLAAAGGHVGDWVAGTAILAGVQGEEYGPVPGRWLRFFSTTKGSLCLSDSA